MGKVIFENPFMESFECIPVGVGPSCERIEDGFVWKDEHIFLHRLGVNTYKPLIPAGSILLVDSRSRWPIDGSLYLLRFGTAWPQIALITPWRNEKRQFGFNVWLEGLERKASFFEHEVREGKDRVVEWVLGRIIGASIMYS